MWQRSARCRQQPRKRPEPTHPRQSNAGTSTPPETLTRPLTAVRTQGNGRPLRAAGYSASVTDTVKGTPGLWLVAALVVAGSLQSIGGSAAATTTAKPTSASVVRIMPLGDSLTAGGGSDPASQQSYRGHLYSTLRAAGYSIDFVGSDATPTLIGGDADNEGHGGYTIGPDTSQYCMRSSASELQCQPQRFNLADNIDGWLAAARPDVILLLVGVNDQYPADVAPGTSGLLRPVNPDEAPAKLTALVGRLAAASTQPWVFVASLPPLVNATPTPSVDLLNTTARSLGSASTTDKVVFVDLASTALVPTDFADAVHLSDAGAAKVADRWFRAIRATLPAPAPGAAVPAALPEAAAVVPTDACAAALTPAAGEVAIPFTTSATSAVSPAERMTDGRACGDDSRWIAAAADPQTLVLHTQTNAAARTIGILWDRSSAASFILESSKDGRIWRRVSSVSKNARDANQFVTAYRIPGTGASYLRLRSMVRTPQAKAAGWGVSIREVVLSAPSA